MKEGKDLFKVFIFLINKAIPARPGPVASIPTNTYSREKLSVDEECSNLSTSAPHYPGGD